MLSLDLKVCTDSIEALWNYLRYGLAPGSFCEALLLENRQLVYKRAHPLLKDGEDVVKNMILFVEEFMPPCCKGSMENIQAWYEHNGLKNASDADKLMTHMYLKDIISKENTDFWKLLELPKP